MTANVEVMFQGYGWRNVFTMRSPTGRSVTLNCNGRWDEMSKELLDLVSRFHYPHVDTYRWGDWATTTVSHDVMAELLEMASR